MDGPSLDVSRRRLLFLVAGMSGVGLLASQFWRDRNGPGEAAPTRTAATPSVVQRPGGGYGAGLYGHGGFGG